MSTKINGNANSGSMSFSEIIGDAMMTSAKANKVASVLTVKNYSIEANAQVDAIHQEVEDNYKTQDDNIKEWNKEHKHKRLHKIFGAIFHAIRAVVHLFEPRKMVKSVVNKATHPKDAVKSVFKRTEKSGMAKEGTKMTSKELKLDSARKFAQKTANWGDVGLAAYDGTVKVQVAKIQDDINKLQLAKNLCENNYDSLESAKKQEMQTVSERLSDAAGSVKAVNDLINRQSSMQSQIISGI